MFYSPEYPEEEQKSCRLHLSGFIFFSAAGLIPPLEKKKKKKTLGFLFQTNLESLSSLLPWLAELWLIDC